MREGEKVAERRWRTNNLTLHYMHYNVIYFNIFFLTP